MRVSSGTIRKFLEFSLQALGVHQHTLKQISFGNTTNGSFFNLGHTNSCTNVSCRLSHIFRSSARRRCFCWGAASRNLERNTGSNASSLSSASLQSGSLWFGDGLGAGVGGDAGAEGRLLCGSVEAKGLLGVRIDRALERTCMLRRLGRRDGEEKGDCGAPGMLRWESASSSSDGYKPTR